MAHASPDPLRTPSAPGFFRAAWSVPRAVLWLTNRPFTWPSAAVPAVILSALILLLLYAALAWLRPLMADHLSFSETWYSGLWSAVISSLGALFAAVIGVFFAFLLAPVLSAPALEHLVSLREAETSAPPRAKQSFISETLCALRATLLATLLTAPFLVLLSLIELLFPPAAVVTVPLKLFVTALLSAYTLFDYPLTLRGVGARRRLAFMRRALPAVLGLGAACSLLFLVPCAGVLLLPVGVVAATGLLWEILAADPEGLALLQLPSGPAHGGPPQ